VLFQSPGGGSLLYGAGPLVFIFLIFYFLLILPQQRKQKQWKAMLGNLKTGDNVTTTGGLRGVIVALRDEDIHLRVPPDNIRIAVARSSIAGISMPEEAKKS
jgi:preprotein translocase subunit YajC